MYSPSLSLFDDASVNELLFIQSVKAKYSKPLGAHSIPLSLSVDSQGEPSPSLALSPSSISMSNPCLTDPVLYQPQVEAPIDTPLFTPEDFPPLSRKDPSPFLTSPPCSPCTEPAFSDPTLMKYLTIFSDKTPVSPSTLPLDSIHFQNVTIRKKRKKPPENLNLCQDHFPFTPLSVRVKDATKNHSLQG